MVTNRKLCMWAGEIVQSITALDLKMQGLKFSLLGELHEPGNGSVHL